MYNATFLVPLTLYGWIPIVLLLFAALPPRRAVITGFLGAWMFLPMGGYDVTGLPSYTKMSATCVGILLGAAIFDMKRLTSVRPRWVDLPMILWCLCPMASSVSNGLGVYDGVSEILRMVVAWGLPYLIGRVYFNDLSALRELAIGIVISGLIYIPLCLYEVRMSPQLHKILYGFYQHSFYQHMRFGGYRPMVFMQHGLMVAMWMTTASILAVWLWVSGAVKKIWNIPIGTATVALLVTTLLCKSVGPTLLLIGALGALFTARSLRTPLPVLCILLIAPAYAVVQTADLVDNREVATAIANVAGPGPAKSMLTRMDNETALSAKALEQPIFGWGGWGRSRIKTHEGDDITRSDGLWIIAFGKYGAVGLFALMTAIAIAVVLFAWRFPSATWSTPAVGPSAALAAVIAVYLIDCLPNAMINPIYMAAAGGIVTITVQAVPVVRRRPGTPRQVAVQPRRIVNS